MPGSTHMTPTRSSAFSHSAAPRFLLTSLLLERIAQSAEANLEESPEAITERPSWVTEIVTLELEHGGGEGVGISEELDLPEGT